MPLLAGLNPLTGSNCGVSYNASIKDEDEKIGVSIP